MKDLIISPTVKPPPHPFYGDSYERGLDPWHVSEMPDEFKDYNCWSRGEQKGGWFLIDAWGNQIGWTPDGTRLKKGGDSMKPKKGKKGCK